MLENLLGKQIELMPRIPKDNEKICDTCGGTGWLYEKEKGYIEHCPVCYGGIITLCSYCQKPKRGVCTNSECRKKREDIDEQNRFNKAIKVTYENTPDNSKGMMYSEAYGYNEGYFTDIEDLIDYCDDEETVVPEYVWSTTEYKLSMDAGSIIEDACSDLHEDAYQNITGEKELQEFLDNWCNNQSGVTSYAVDYKYAIQVPKNR